MLTCSLLLVLVLCFCSFTLCFDPYLGTMPRKTKAHRTTSTSFESPTRVELFKNDKCREAYDTLNCRRKIWFERAIVLDALNPAIRVNFESRGRLPLLEIDHPSPTALIREFFSILSCHIYDSNTLVMSWIWGVEFTITPRVVAEALGVQVIREPIYPYDKTPPLDVVMSYITGSSIQWGSDP